MFNSVNKKHSKTSLFNTDNNEKNGLLLLPETTKINEIKKYNNYLTNNSTRLSWITNSLLNKKYSTNTTINFNKPNKINQKSQSLDNNNKNNNYRENRKSIRSLQAKFASSLSGERGNDDCGGGGGNSGIRGGIITNLNKYTTEELKEYRQIFNYFDADRSGAIGIDELESAITNLGMDSKQIDVEMLMREADKRGNHQIDFDEFCEVMKTTSEKTQSWNEIIKECFNVFDRNESGLISKKDFDFVLRELGDIQNSRLIDELFVEYDVDGDGFIDFDEVFKWKILI
ncbi:hypothetical protein Mgra_00003984 [Meloidogyne graminicola]|uniref:EF-hand domain-containing protein n=1 Tax=Meloidogyne graminicola TaxID=189291 RepID=A0A8S9ZTK7_9BILA|nr:hypothetical protein Mgra_00003984 [Meloidogyne graminicola]